MQFNLDLFWKEHSKYFHSPTEGESYHLPLIIKLAASDANINGVYQFSYILATATWETGRFMHLDELGSDKYLSKYQNRIGNVEAGDYQRYRGRGYVQLTGRANYKTATAKLNLDNIDFVATPHLAAELPYAYQIIVRGCLEGWFTGRKLSEYVSEDGTKCDYRNARNVVNPNELKIANSQAVNSITLWATWYKSILQQSVVDNDQLPEIPAEYVTDASPDLQSTRSSTVAITPTVTAPVKNEETNNLTNLTNLIKDDINNYGQKALDILQVSTGTAKRIGMTLLGCITTCATGIGAFIKSEPVISGIIIIIALLGLIWIISLYIYIEHTLDAKRIDAGADPKKNSVK